MKTGSKPNSQYSIPFPQMDITYADFFCGCGGLSLGFIKAGLKCVAAMDIAPDALWTFWYNLCYKGWSHFWVNPDNPMLKSKRFGLLKDNKTSNFLFPNGIPDNWLSREVKEPMPCLNLFMYSINDLEPEEFMEMCQVRPGDIKIFAGGPPCQGFSTSNSFRHALDERNQLPIRYIYYAKVCKPKIVLMENVPGILSLGKKKGDKEGPFPIWLREKFDEAGYEMDYQIINAADYGVPQNRRRVFFFAVRKGEEKIDHPEKTHGEGKEPYVTVRETIGDLPPLSSGDQWGKTVLHPYGYNAIEGHVICPKCLKYNKVERKYCHNCGCELSNPIQGGVLEFPGIGTMVDCQRPIDNEKLKKISLL
jgi:site-specific DNA-cytosine methylase